MGSKLRIRAILAKDAVTTGGDIGALVELWDVFNVLHFDAAMAPAIIRLDEPGTPRRLGQYSPVGGDGLPSVILIRPSLLAGTHPICNPVPSRDGLANFVADVLLHEMVHQYCHEVLDRPDTGFHGHGPAFRDVANRIGRELDLAPVRTCKRRGPDAHLPSASQWPHNVRPADYYQGAIRQDSTQSQPEASQQLRDVLAQRLAHLDEAELVKLAQRWPVADRHVIQATRPAIPRRHRSDPGLNDAGA